MTTQPTPTAAGGTDQSGVLFDEPTAGVFWTCVRTRPRWEKRFSQWLRHKDIPHWLPVFDRTTTSHRKTRTTEIPVFPGYVFVRGAWSKADFQDSGTVVRVIKPSSPPEALHLHQQLKSVWQALASGLLVTPTTEFAVGEKVEVLDGPLMGSIGRFVQKDRRGLFIVSLDMLGTEVAVSLEAGTRVLAADDGRRIAA